jgi:DNA polymerase-3 subunit delta'
MPVVPLSQLLGQPDVSAFLRGVVERGRYGNAYLFHGPAGVGKGTAAIAFARAALCDRVPGAAAFAAREDDGPSLFGDAPPAPAAEFVTGDDACGECPACGKSAQLMHPDLKFLFPVSGEEKELEGVIIATLTEWREDPLYTFQYDRAASLRVSQTRELQRDLAYRPYEASRRVVVVRDCDRMREDQYSMLLKSLEEPAATTMWILTTSRLSRVPATIRSRCQRVRFAPLAEETVRDVLTHAGGVGDAEARILAALGSGSLARALALRGEGAIQKRDAALALLEPALRGDTLTLWKAVQTVSSGASKNREALRRMLEFHMLWLRDVLRAGAGSPKEMLVNRDREADIRALATRIGPAEVRRRLFVIEEALRSIDGNISADLTLGSALMRIAGSRVGENAWPPHPTARWDI